MPFSRPQKSHGSGQTALMCATDLLARRAYGEVELLKKLRAKGFPPAECEEAVEKFRAKGILSDTSFVEQLVREAERSGRGRFWLLNKMREAGIEGAAQEDLLRQNDFDGDKELAIGQRYFARHFGAQADLNEPKKRAAAVRHLQGRGFSGAILYKIMRASGLDDFFELTED